MNLFYHLIYEYQKELRDLILYTCSNELAERMKINLEKQGIKYLIYPVTKEKINIFFGAPECLQIVKNFSSSNLSKLTPAEDFILGIMLGYGKAQQYERYLTRIKACA
ncbi:DUF2023 family protein [bacterium]|nr:DUF2023 family protein [bacterium]